MDETFGPQLRAVGAAAPVDQTQFIFCTATLPDTVVNSVQREFPDVVQIRGPGLHRVALTVKERLVDVSVPSKNNRDAKLGFNIKANCLLDALRQTRCTRTLIFCNTVETCRQVENLLNRKDRKGKFYNVLAYHSAMTPETRNANLAAFSQGGGAGDSDSILVCTDRAARGVDFEAAPVEHVVIFDFPADPAEYVRRVGRTARAGRSGFATVFAYGWQLPIARTVMGSTKLDTGFDRFGGAAYDDDDDSVEFKRRGSSGGKSNKKIQKGKDAIIKGNIEGGRLWRDRWQNLEEKIQKESNQRKHDFILF